MRQTSMSPGRVRRCCKAVHDLPWWHKQLVCFFGRWLDDDLVQRLD
jgi:hypothetical protein